MPGVAYTTGIDLDDDHKEIHFSTDYIARVSKERKENEILGVLRHEMVHCFQYNGFGTAPAGLIEGIADWVRLQSGLVPPHWSQSGEGNWDAGYEHTGYFLEYLEKEYGQGTVRKLNARLRDQIYDEDKFWLEQFRKPVDILWKEYGESLMKTEESYPRVEDGKLDIDSEVKLIVPEGTMFQAIDRVIAFKDTSHAI